MVAPREFMTNSDGTISIFTVALPIFGGVAAFVFDEGAALCAKARAGMHRTAATVTNLMATFLLSPGLPPVRTPGCTTRHAGVGHWRQRHTDDVDEDGCGAVRACQVA